MFRLQPSSHQRPRGGAPLHGLPFATVVTLAGVVLLLGRGGGGADGGDAVAAAGAELAAADPASLERTRSVEDAAPGPERLAAIAAPFGERRLAAGEEGLESAPESGGCDPLPLAGREEADGRGEVAGIDPAPLGLEGLRAEGPYHLGSRHGEWTFYDLQGYVQEVGSYRAGRRDGAWRQYAQNGQMIQLAEYVDGAQEGLWRRFSREGELLEEGRYEASAPHGRWVRRYSDGSIKERGIYEAGLREGPWEFFDDLGRPTLRTGTYRAGIRID